MPGLTSSSGPRDCSTERRNSQARLRRPMAGAGGLLKMSAPRGARRRPVIAIGVRAGFTIVRFYGSRSLGSLSSCRWPDCEIHRALARCDS